MIERPCGNKRPVKIRHDWSPTDDLIDSVPRTAASQRRVMLPAGMANIPIRAFPNPPPRVRSLLWPSSCYRALLRVAHFHLKGRFGERT